MKELIESIQNKLVKKIKALQQRKNREKEGLFIVEGVRFVQEIPTNYTILFYAVSDTFQKINDISVYENKSQVFIFSDDVFCAIADTQHTQGILAVCQKKEIELFYFELKELAGLLHGQDAPDGVVLYGEHAGLLLGDGPGG